MVAKVLNPQALRAIAVCRISALGDIVMMVPMVRTLQQYFPEATITWIISSAFYPLVEGMDGVDFIVIDKPTTRADYKKLKQLFKHRQFDVLLAVQANMRVNRIYRLINASVKVGFDRARARDLHQFFVDEQIPAQQNHLLDGFMQFAEYLGAEPIIRWDLPISEADRQFARQQLADARWVAINPMASKVDRNWLPERWLALINTLQAKGYRVVLTGSANEQEIALAAELQSGADKSVVNLVGQTSLKQLAAVLADVEVLVCPDTGPAHLACAMGTKVIGLFADVSPDLTAAYLSRDLAVDYYHKAMLAIHNKTPEKIKWQQRVHDQRAMAMIELVDVLAKLKIALGDMTLDESVKCHNA